MTESRLIFTNCASSELRSLISGIAPSGVAVVTDTNVDRIVMPRLGLDDLPRIVIPAGEANKNLDTLATVWSGFISAGLTRRSLIINIGGGVVTDLGGFAAATFKRGVRFINVPTTLLGAVDAAVGGKTGIDFAGLKNEVGAFAAAEAVIFDPSIFSTLPREELLSGYGEMIKHALLSGGDDYARFLSGDIPAPDSEEFTELLRKNVEIKKTIVDSDPLEAGPRKALNLGHTFGHAIETLLLRRNRPVAHGIAVAYGLLVSMIISHLEVGFPSSYLQPYAAMIKSTGMADMIRFTCDDYDELLEIMSHDKKNPDSSTITFTLLSAPGSPLTDRPVDPTSAILPALDISRDLIGF